MSEQLTITQLAAKVIERRLEISECSGCGLESFAISGTTEKLANEVLLLTDQLTAAQSRVAELEQELSMVLSDWNDLVGAIGSRSHGGAIGHAKQVVARADELTKSLAMLELDNGRLRERVDELENMVLQADAMLWEDNARLRELLQTVADWHNMDHDNTPPAEVP